ncbi:MULTISPECIES: hypothetical protein [unclassified Mesorhizobium]|uniref:hypothetical protein n=1 Tax=unclassified Mesorhizobium TaxID=325217 RepID=UPI00333919F2
MLKKILAASVLTIALAGSPLAQTNGTGAGGTAGTGNGTGTGTVGSGGAAGNGTGSGNAAVPTDPNSTNSTTKSNGMTDRCKDAAGNDIDNNTASGATTSTVQNCNK